MCFIFCYRNEIRFPLLLGRNKAFRFASQTYFNWLYDRFLCSRGLLCLVCKFFFRVTIALFDNTTQVPGHFFVYFFWNLMCYQIKIRAMIILLWCIACLLYNVWTLGKGLLPNLVTVMAWYLGEQSVCSKSLLMHLTHLFMFTDRTSTCTLAIVHNVW